MIFLAGAAVGLLAGWAAGGRLDRLGDIRVELLWLLIAGLVFHRILPLFWRILDLPPGLELAQGVVLYGSVLGFLAANWRMPGAALALAGGLANALAVAWGGGRMPVWGQVIGRMPGRFQTALVHSSLGTHVLMVRPHGLGFLGDILVLPRPIPADVISIGDLLIAAAMAIFLARSMAPPRPRRPGSGR